MVCRMVWKKTTKGYHVYEHLQGDSSGVGTHYFSKAFIHSVFGGVVPAVVEIPSLVNVTEEAAMPKEAV